MTRRLKEWICRQNIKHFEAAITREADDAQREVLKGMLEREESRLRRLMESDSELSPGRSFGR